MRSKVRTQPYAPKLVTKALRVLARKGGGYNVSYEGLKLLYEKDEASVRDVTHVICEYLIAELAMGIALVEDFEDPAHVRKRAEKELS